MRDPLEGVDDDGCILTGADRTRVPAAYEPVLEALLEAELAASSVLLYGSVATGQAQPPASDVDVVLVGAPEASATVLGEELSWRFAGLCREVAVGVAPLQAYEGDDDEAHGNRAFLRHYCVVLAGDDLAADWPPFPADARAARGFNGDIAQYLHRWRDRARVRPQLHPLLTVALGRSVGRKTLLAAAGLVSVHDGTWTTDRATGARRWAEVDPRTGDDLAGLLAWAEGAQTATVSDVHRVLAADGVVQRVADAFRDEVGLWDVS